MKLIPSILAKTEEELERKVRLAESLTTYVQIDFMDGAFAPMKSISLESLLQIKPQLRMEAHLMVERPGGWVIPLRTLGFERIYFHIEAEPQPRQLIERTHALGMSAGVVINPETPFSALDPALPVTDAITFLGVHLSRLDMGMDPTVLGKVEELKRREPDIRCGIDGGVTLANLDSVKATGCDYITVGGAIFDADDPPAAFQEFKERLEGEAHGGTTWRSA